jgi:general secretion pathway protein K
MSSRRLSPLRQDRTAAGERGVVLILAIFAVALLSVLAVAIIVAVRAELLASRSSLERTRALFLAEAGLHQASAILLYDDQTVDTLVDSWGPLCEEPLDWPRELQTGTYRVRVYDACGRLDVNEADYPTLVRLTGDAQVAAAIIDWRDADGEPLPGGVEEAYYTSLAHPYQPRNAPFQTLGELLLVRGVTPELFFGEEGRPGLAELLSVESTSLNTDANGRQRFSLNAFRNWSEEAFRESVMQRLGGVLSLYDAAQIWQGLTILPGQQYTSLGQLATAAGLGFDKAAALADLVTVEDSVRVAGRVNVNTASIEVLASLPGSSQEVAAAIVARRDEQPFSSPGEVAELLLSQSDGERVFSQMIDSVTTKSSSFLVEAMGLSGTGDFRTLRALIRRLEDDVRMVQVSEQDWPLPPHELPGTAVARRSPLGIS